jgi:catalase
MSSSLLHLLMLLGGAFSVDTNLFQKANFLSSVGEKTPVFVRFSTVTFGREFPDEGRNPRGFAIKFYTMEGNYDIVGLNFVSFPWFIFCCPAAKMCGY